MNNPNVNMFSWLFPITYLLHIAEEYWAGFPAYLSRTQRVELSPGRFLLLQAFGLVLMVVGILLARRLNFPNLILVILGAVVLANAFVHIFRSLAGTQYEPGLLTALLVWLPLGCATLLRFRGGMKTGRYLLGTAIGAGVAVLVELITIGHHFWLAA